MRGRGGKALQSNRLCAANSYLPEPIAKHLAAESTVRCAIACLYAFKRGSAMRTKMTTQAHSRQGKRLHKQRRKTQLETVDGLQATQGKGKGKCGRGSESANGGERECEGEGSSECGKTNQSNIGTASGYASKVHVDVNVHAIVKPLRGNERGRARDRGSASKR